ncbi:MAG: response regulator [Candidatus Omnitrophica bacterium]|nr:response regulator [Candidatus Omnitrophota bacterium]
MEKIDTLPMRMLIIEDDEDTSFIQMRAFEQLGFKVIHVKNGDEAYAKILDYKPHIIVLDLELPGTPGPAIASKILEDDRLKNIPIVVDSVHVSNYSNPDGLDTQYFWAQYMKTRNKEPRIVQKSEGNSIFGLITEVGLACGETYGVVPLRLMDYFKRMRPTNTPPFEVV